MHNDNPTVKPTTPLEALIANTCFCKLKSACPDKNSAECMRHRNLYEEFMREKHQKPINQ